MYRSSLLASSAAIAVLLGACGGSNTGENLTGEYQFGFPDDRDRAALEAIAKECGKGPGVKAARVDTGVTVGPPVVIVEFEKASLDEQKRVAKCAEAAGSDSTAVP